MANIVHSKKYLTKDLASFTKAKEISGNNLKALRTLSYFWENVMLREDVIQ